MTDLIQPIQKRIPNIPALQNSIEEICGSAPEAIHKLNLPFGCFPKSLIFICGIQY